MSDDAFRGHGFDSWTLAPVVHTGCDQVDLDLSMMRGEDRTLIVLSMTRAEIRDLGNLLLRVSGDAAQRTFDPKRLTLAPAPPRAAAPIVVAETVAAPSPREVARAHGFTGDMCGSCGSFAMKRAGTCLTCQACGSTTGCS
ncbi:MAG: hypothetical protein K2Y56_23400 [Methylobacterium sp.]|uniref:hypothetical protein n=1 Tax=Methylobacterium sp. TaxID=409 RepID=UPI0025E800D6|nr:hypothetical protein [Methylobacterium sp.]MBX9934423.1 hypothetical protein [Methylobacterium sp.]